jgi:hypothetical protein
MKGCYSNIYFIGNKLIVAWLMHHSNFPRVGSCNIYTLVIKDRLITPKIIHLMYILIGQ